MYPFSAILTYLASVVRAETSIALAKMAQTPMPTNPNKVVKSLSRKRSAYGCRTVIHPGFDAAAVASGQAFGLVTNSGEVELKKPQQLNYTLAHETRK